MLVKASVARSPNQLAQHVRQKVLVAAVARGVPTINDLLKRADEDKSGALSYKEFYTTLRKLLQLTAAAVTDDAVRQTFKVIDKTGDGALSREEFATFLRGKNTSDDAQLVDCLDAKNKLAARQAALRRKRASSCCVNDCARPCSSTAPSSRTMIRNGPWTSSWKSCAPR